MKALLKPGFKRWRKSGLFLIPDQHEPGKERPFGDGKSRKKKGEK